MAYRGISDCFIKYLNLFKKMNDGYLTQIRKQNNKTPKHWTHFEAARCLAITNVGLKSYCHGLMVINKSGYIPWFVIKLISNYMYVS